MHKTLTVFSILLPMLSYILDINALLLIHILTNKL